MRNVAVCNPEGLHLRAATVIAEHARRYQSAVVIVRNELSVAATDVIQLVSLGAVQGTELVLEAQGSDAEQALDDIASLFVDGFGENA